MFVKDNGQLVDSVSAGQQRAARSDHQIIDQSRPARGDWFRYPLSSVLNGAELYLIAVLVLYTALALVFYPHVVHASALIYQNIMVMLAMTAIAMLHRLNAGKIISFVRLFYLPLIIYLAYAQVFSYIPVVHPRDYDVLLIEIDRWILGTDPTVWLGQFAHPVLTEFLQLSYMLFFFNAMIHLVELYRRDKVKELSQLSRLIVFSFVASYVLYFIMPAVGPRFLLHDFYAIDKELPGLWFTSGWRQWVNAGDGIERGVTNAFEIVHRNCMPSGHTWVTLVNIILAFKFRSRSRWFFLVMGTSLMFSTVYLRYHYVADLIVGALLAVLSVWLEPKVHRSLERLGVISEPGLAPVDNDQARQGTRSGFTI